MDYGEFSSYLKTGPNRWKLSLKMPHYLIFLTEQWEERAGGKKESRGMEGEGHEGERAADNKLRQVRT